MQKTFSFLLMVFLLFAGISSFAQSKYNAHAAFAPFFYPHNGNQYRSADGSPGADYWQNSADYNVHVKFDTATKLISGEVKITYTNNSPHNLSYVWLELDQNIDKKDSRANNIRNPAPLNSGNEANDVAPGFHIQKVEVIENGKAVELKDYIINDTRMQVWLPEKLKAKDGKLQMMIGFDYTLQRSGGGGRSGYLNTKNGVIYDVSYWYPRMEVYDDLAGWNTLPFLGGGEFYLDYGNIDYTITLPAGMIVAGAGKLINPQDVLTSNEMHQLDKASHSDKTLIIHSPEDGEAATHAPFSVSPKGGKEGG
ncbi:MAG: M1 family peptidase, partial [Chitinophagaceae bacterium]